MPAVVPAILIPIFDFDVRVNEAFSARNPRCTLTVPPVSATFAWIVVVPAPPLFFSVPVLLNAMTVALGQMQSSPCESIVPAFVIEPPEPVYKVPAFNTKLVPLAITNPRDNCPAADTNEILPLGASNDVTPEPDITPLLQVSVPLTLSEPAPSRVPPLRPSVAAVEGLTESLSVKCPPETFSVPLACRVAMLVVPAVKSTVKLGLMQTLSDAPGRISGSQFVAVCHDVVPPPPSQVIVQETAARPLPVPKPGANVVATATTSTNQAKRGQRRNNENTSP